MASLIIHALLALLLFSLATSSSEQTAPESFSGGAIVTVTREAPQKNVPVTAKRAAIPIPHAPVVPKPVAKAQPRSAPPHPRVLHELAKNNPKGPPNPTPAPVSSAAPNPVPTQPEIAVTAAPIPATVPTSVPVKVAAVSVKVPPTAAPLPKPTTVPTAAPQTPQPQPTIVRTAPPVTPAPQPSALEATEAPIVPVQPQAVVTPGTTTPVHVAVRPTPGVPSPGPTAAPPSQQHGTAPTPGPKAAGSPGPSGVAPVKGPKVARPVQAPPATPRPAPVTAAKKTHESLNRRLQNLIPTAAPSVSPAPPKKYSFLGNIKPTPLPEPTPPADVIAATKFLYVENVGGQRWKQSILGTAPEEGYVKMYVTSVKHVGFVKWCTGYVVRHPITDAEHDHWIVEPNQSVMCPGSLEPFTPAQQAQPSPSPSATPTSEP